MFQDRAGACKEQTTPIGHRCNPQVYVVHAAVAHHRIMKFWKQDEGTCTVGLETHLYLLGIPLVSITKKCIKSTWSARPSCVNAAGQELRLGELGGLPTRGISEINIATVSG